MHRLATMHQTDRQMDAIR